MKGFLRFLILAVLPVGILVSVLLWSPLLEIRTLDVTGQEKCSTEEILQASGLAAGANPLLPIEWRRGEWPRPNLISAAERIRRLPWVETASVDWLPLHAVRIRIAERKPFAVLPYLGGSLMLDANGVVLESVNGDLPADVREIRGIRFAGYANGRMPETEDPQLLQTGLGVLKALKQSGTGEGPRLFDVVRWVDVLAADRVDGPTRGVAEGYVAHAEMMAAD